MLKRADAAVIIDCTREMEDIMETSHFFDMNEHTIRACARWDDFCGRLFHAYQDLALAEAEN